MAFKISERSLFAILLRSSWWYSVLIGLALIAVSLVFVGGQYGIIGIFGSLPFFGIAGVAGYKQFNQPSQQRTLQVVSQARTMSAAQIASKIAASYTEVHYESKALKGSAAEVELTRGNRKIVLCTKRFKVGNTGIESLKQLVAAGEKIEATGYLYVALGEISNSARDYATQNNIELIEATRLATFFDGKANVE